MATSTPATKSHGRSILKIYFLLMTLVGVIGTLVSLGFLLYAVGKKVIITNDEYIVAERSYDLDVCSQATSKPTATNQNNMTYPTDAEIAKCKADKKATLIQARNATFKTDVLGESIWTILFFILLMVHYPRFMGLTKKAE